MVERVKDYIHAGDTFQTVVSQRLSAPMTADPLDFYRVLRVINPSPYLFIFDFEDFQVVGSSPEALVRVTGRAVETWPIAGTRPRGATPAEDDQLAAELMADVKERAEHVMLVDLGRNDLGRVSEIGSVEVAQMMQVERYSHVMHIVSTVVGTLREELSPIDVLRAVFPAGTVSGAPKVRAMEIIDELEPSRRGIYAGAAGYVDFSGNLDMCIALRTAVIVDGVAHVQAGAGIVADSRPDVELVETRNKAGALLAAVAAAEAMRQEPVVTTPFLDVLLAEARSRVAADRARRGTAALRADVAALDTTPPSFVDALAADGVGVIAEVKRASPSKGDLAPDLDAVVQATAYRDAEVAAISVLTEPARFKGSLDDLRAVAALGTPSLRKDFTVDVHQVLQARLAGAAAVLLIVAALDDDDLAELARSARDCGLDCLVEVHDEEELRRALTIDPAVVGVNARDLRTFDVDRDAFARLRDSIPADVVAVAESGITGPDDVRRAASQGADAVLVGESLVTAGSPRAAAAALVAAGRDHLAGASDGVARDRRW